MPYQCSLGELVLAKGGVYPFLGLGTVKFGRSNNVKYPQSFIVPSVDNVKNILNESYSWGIRLIDTAPAYGVSENVLGKVLQVSSKNWVVGTKVGEIFNGEDSTFNFSAEFTFSSVERSLRNLRVDSLDYVLIHSNGDDVNVLSMGVVNALMELKRQGIINLVGISAKTFLGCVKAIEYGLDIIMIDMSFPQVEFSNILKLAVENKVSVIIKKPFNSGYSSPKNVLRRLSVTEGISGVVFGSIDIEHIKDNAKCFFHFD